MEKTTDHLAVIWPTGVVGNIKAYFDQPRLVPKPNNGKTYERRVIDGTPYWIEKTD